jgi:hypothetical protein
MEYVQARLRPLASEEETYLRGLVQRLRRSSKLRSLADCLLSGEQVPEVPLILCRVIEDPTQAWRERVLATWLLPRLTLNDAQRLAATHSLMVGLKNREAFNPTWGCFGIIGGPLVLLTVPLAITASLVTDSRSHCVGAAAADALGELGLPETVGALAQATRAYAGGVAASGSRRAEAAAAEALLKVLRSQVPAHIWLMEPPAIQDLCWVMLHAQEPLAVAILQLLEKVGDGGAVGAVAGLAHSARSNRLRAEARRILPALEERWRRAKQQEMLLRVSSVGAEPDEVLLRPTGMSESEQTLLLRSVHREENG